MSISGIISAFFFGGLLSLIAQILIDLTKLTPARILVIYVTFGTLLGAVGIYKILFSIAGAGVSVPLIGFGAAIAKGVKEAVDLYGFLGIFKGPLSAASAGCTAALVFGFLCAVFLKGKPKRS